MAILKKEQDPQNSESVKIDRIIVNTAAEVIEEFAKRHTLDRVKVTNLFMKSETGQRLMRQETEYWMHGFAPLYREFEAEQKNSHN